MKYANIDDIEQRIGRNLSESDETSCMALLEDAGVIIDSYNPKAPEDAKKLVSCNMIIRRLGTGEGSQFPIGVTQGTASALGYSQSFTFGNGASGEMYLTRTDKKLLGSGHRIGFASPWEGT